MAGDWVFLPSGEAGDDLLCGAVVIGDTNCRSYVVGFQVLQEAY